MSEEEHKGMGKRGVSRPMAMKEHGGGGGEDGGDGGGGGMMMSPGQRKKMLHMHHKQTLWCYWTVILLGRRGDHAADDPARGRAARSGLEERPLLMAGQRPQV